MCHGRRLLLGVNNAAMKMHKSQETGSGVTVEIVSKLYIMTELGNKSKHLTLVKNMKILLDFAVRTF